MKVFDYLIVGGGIAGSALAFEMSQAQQDFAIVEHTAPGSSTLVSAGLINPVTGMRFVLSWNFPLIEMAFNQFYQRFQQHFGVKILYEHAIWQKLENEDACNQWMIRANDIYYQPYVEPIQDVPFDKFRFSDPKYGKIKRAYRIDVQLMLTSVSEDAIQKGQWISGNYSPMSLRKQDGMWWLDNLGARKAILFAEGFKAIFNPLWENYPIIPLKGDCSTFTLENLQFIDILKSTYSLIPLGGNRYWCGSSYKPNDKILDLDLDEIERQRHFIEKITGSSPNNFQGFFGIRAASRDRRPIIGAHHVHPECYLFNGFGTKGASLVPYCAQQLIDHLLRKSSIDPAISIQRFL